MSTTTNNNSLSAFWKRPEGKPGMVVLAAALGVGVYFLNKALPFLINLMNNTIHAAILAGVLVAIGAVVTNSRFRATVWYLYKGLMRAITGLAIELNPIAILESYVEDLKDKMRKMDVQLQELRGQIGELNKKIELRTEEFNKHMDLASTAKRLGRPGDVQLNILQTQRLEKYLKKLHGLSSKMEILYKVLEKMRYYSDIMIKNTEMDVEIRIEERKSITKGHSVMKSALNIIKGNDDKRMIFDQAMEFVVDDIGFKVGEMDRMLEASTDFINSVDLENAMYEDRGMQMLEEFDKKGLETIFGVNNSLAEGTQTYNAMNNFAAPAQYATTSTTKGTDEKKKYFN